MKHGTRGSYVRGCRCKACVQANAANGWARAQIKDWKGPAISCLVTPDSNGIVLGDFVPHTFLLEAIKRNEKKLKLDALELYWAKFVKGA